MGEKLAEELASFFGLPLIDREYVYSHWLPKIASAHQLKILKESAKAHLGTSSIGIPYHIYIEQKLKEVIHDSGGIVILGLGAQMIFKHAPNAFHIRVVASLSNRVQRVCEQFGIDRVQAEKHIALSDRKHKKYLHYIYNQDWNDSENYHITFNTDNLSIKTLLQVIHSCFPQDIYVAAGSENSKAKIPKEKNKKFVHQSEDDFVKVLDMYHIEWKYEPTTFPIEWDAEGNVTMAFTPDFYLPAYHSYVELTTMKQKYVALKRKKLRKLRALYPEINVIILYKNDINKLLRKFGVIKES